MRRHYLCCGLHVPRDLDLACVQFFDHNVSFRAAVAAGAAEINAIGRVHFSNREFAEALSAFQEGAPSSTT